METVRHAQFQGVQNVQILLNVLNALMDLHLFQIQIRRGLIVKDVKHIAWPALLELKMEEKRAINVSKVIIYSMVFVKGLVLIV